MTSLFDKIDKRLSNLKPVWDDVEEILRDDFKDQFEGSHGPDGKKWKTLEEETLEGRGTRGSRRSSKPYDTQEHETWDEMVKGGKVTKSKDELKIEVTTAGVHQFKYRPVGVSKKAVTDIGIKVAKYLVGED